MGGIFNQGDEEAINIVLEDTWCQGLIGGKGTGSRGQEYSRYFEQIILGQKAVNYNQVEMGK